MTQPKIAAAARPPKPQAVLEVRSRQWISPRLLRLELGGPEFHKIRVNSHCDAYVKLLLPVPGSGLEPPFNLDAIRASNPAHLPRKRTYTVRQWKAQEEAIVVDFVIHNEPGHTGIASDWAQQCAVGDRVALMGAGGGYTPNTEIAHHLLIGDHAAVPAIAASVERLSSGAAGKVLIHVEHGDDVIDLDHPSLDIQWVVGDRSSLLEQVKQLSMDPTAIENGDVQVFCHAERELTKRLRKHLVVERGIPRDAISISAYWAEGRVEDQFQAEKREEIGKIDPEA